MSENETNEPSREEMERVIARVQKLLSRTKDGAGTSEAEADTAMRLAQDLLAKYNLDMADVEARSEEARTAVERVKEEFTAGTRFKWQRQLAAYVAEANFCYHLLRDEWQDGRYKRCKEEGEHTSHYKCVRHQDYADGFPQGEEYYAVHVQGRYVPRHVFVGRKANVITAQLMFRYLCETIEKQVPVENKARLSKFAQSWKEGAADRLCERLAQKRHDLIKEHDARIAQEEAERLAVIKKAHAEADAKKAKQLPANEGAETEAAIGGLRAQSRVGHSSVPDSEEPERPEVNEDDESFNPADLEESPEIETGTAMVKLSEFSDAEAEANYEVAHGLKPGQLAQWRKEREEEQAQREKEEAEEAAQAEMDAADKPVREETEKERQKREAREAREYEKRRERLDRIAAREERKERNANYKEWARLDHTAYKAGVKQGEKIGIDVQVAAQRDVKRLAGRGDK